MLTGVDLSNDQNRKQAYDKVLAAFTQDYGAKVLATPQNDMSWLFPSIAAVGALGLLIFAGRRWVSRSGTEAVVAHGPTAIDEAYADKLDDELSETD